VPTVTRREEFMSFIQTISYITTKPEELQALSEQFDRDNPDAPGFVGIKILKDRDKENTYLVIAEFENYEVAMENSARPETDAFAKKMSELVDGPPTFGNYDVIQTMGG
jgi:quinol monooxygenase YgiN